MNGKTKVNKTGDMVEWRITQMAGNTENELKIEYITDPGSNNINIKDW